MGIFDRIGIYLEIKVVVPICEGLSRTWLKLDPRVYSQKLRIRQVEEYQPLKSQRFVILAMWGGGKVQPYLQTLFDALAKTDLNLVVVSNSKIRPATREVLAQYAHIVMERSNVGRDFGAYKDGILHLQERYPEIERIMLLNDSVYYFPKGLDDLIARLDGEDDFIGLTEVHEHHYHVQSFMLSFGKAVLQSKVFQQYWKNYLPIGTRRWSIHKGEVGLSQRLLRGGFRPTILFHAAQLYQGLGQTRMGDIETCVSLLPDYFRARMSSMVDASRAEQMDLLRSLSGIVPNSPVGHNLPVPAVEDATRASDIWAVLINENRREISRISYKRVRDVVRLIGDRNQVHLGGFLFYKFFDMPIIKRDIVYREVFKLDEVWRILYELEMPFRDEIIADLRQKGSAEHIPWPKKILYRHGSI